MNEKAKSKNRRNANGGDCYWFETRVEGLSLRFGPFDSDELQNVVERATDEQIPGLVTSDEGRDIDWGLLKRLHAKEYPKIELVL